MSEATSRLGVKTRAVSLPDELHAQITLVAKLDGVSWQDAVRQAVEEYVARKRDEGDLAARAAEALAEIERDAAARRDALTALFGPGALTAVPDLAEPATPEAEAAPEVPMADPTGEHAPTPTRKRSQARS